MGSTPPGTPRGAEQGAAVTSCAMCCVEIEDDEVEKCDVCEADGICNDCLMDHECDGGKPQGVHDA